MKVSNIRSHNQSINQPSILAPRKIPATLPHTPALPGTILGDKSCGPGIRRYCNLHSRWLGGTHWVARQDTNFRQQLLRLLVEALTSIGTKSCNLGRRFQKIDVVFGRFFVQEKRTKS